MDSDEKSESIRQESFPPKIIGRKSELETLLEFSMCASGHCTLRHQGCRMWPNLLYLKSKPIPIRN